MYPGGLLDGDLAVRHLPVLREVDASESTGAQLLTAPKTGVENQKTDIVWLRVRTGVVTCVKRGAGSYLDPAFLSWLDWFRVSLEG